MTSWDIYGEGLVKKPTGFATNSPCLAAALEKPCSNDSGNSWHRHVPLVGGKARAAQVYPPKLVSAILEGFRQQLIADALLHPNEIGTVCCEEGQPSFEDFFNYEATYDEYNGSGITARIGREGKE